MLVEAWGGSESSKDDRVLLLPSELQDLKGLERLLWIGVDPELLAQKADSEGLLDLLHLMAQADDIEDIPAMENWPLGPISERDREGSGSESKCSNGGPFRPCRGLPHSVSRNPV